MKISVHHQDDKIPVGGPLPPAHSAWIPESSTIALTGCRGETISFQLVVDEPCQPPAIMVAPGALKRDDITIYQHQSIFVDAVRKDNPGKDDLGAAHRYDPLMPARADTYSPAFWFDIAIPYDAAPGWTVSALQIGSTIIWLRVRIADITLPEAPVGAPFVSGFHIDQFNKAHGVVDWQDSVPLLWKYMEMAEAHGVTLAMRGFLPSHNFNPNGTIKGVFWDKYDNAMGPYIESGIGPWCLPVKPWFPRSKWEPNTTNGQNAIRSWFTEVRNHWQAKGWPLKNAFVWIYDEPGLHGPLAATELTEYYRLVKSVAPEVNILVSGVNSGGAPTSTYLEGADIITATGDQYNPEEMIATGKVSWPHQSYAEPSLPGETIDFKGPGFRLWPWIAEKFITRGMLYWSCNRWHERPFEVPDGQPASYNDGQGVMLYPGPVPSIRLKEIRRGMDDLKILSLLPVEEINDVVSQVVKSALATSGYPYVLPKQDPRWIEHGHGEWLQDGASFEKMRLSMIERLEKQA